MDDGKGEVDEVRGVKCTGGTSSREIDGLAAAYLLSTLVL